MQKRHHRQPEWPWRTNRRGRRRHHRDCVSSSAPGGTLLLEAIYAAISAAGPTGFDLTAPAADVSFATGHLPGVWTVTFVVTGANRLANNAAKQANHQARSMISNPPPDAFLAACAGRCRRQAAPSRATKPPTSDGASLHPTGRTRWPRCGQWRLFLANTEFRPGADGGSAAGV